jgi:hypothetical protein
MAFTCEAVAGRGLGASRKTARLVACVSALLVVILAPLMAGLVRTSTTSGQPGDLVLHGLLARLVGPANDDLKARGVVEEAGIEFGLDGA